MYPVAPILFLIFILSHSVSGEPQKSEYCSQEKICIIHARDQTGASLYFRNDSGISNAIFTVEVNAKLKNMNSKFRLPFVMRVSGDEEVFATRFESVVSEKPWSYQVFYRSDYGDYDATHNDSYIYELPFQQGFRFRVSQAFPGNKTHQGENSFAIDFGLPEGTQITAARDGVVVDTEDRNTEGGFNSKFLNSANFIKILHSDNTISQYAHLQYKGVLVKKGQLVRAGQEIGLSGNTGFSDGPHLHFEVYRLNKELKKETIQIRFRTAMSNASLLHEGELHWRRDPSEKAVDYFLDEKATYVCRSLQELEGMNCDLPEYSPESIVIFISLIKPKNQNIEVDLNQEGTGVGKSYIWDTQPNWWITYLSIDLIDLTRETKGMWVAKIKSQGKVWKEIKFKVSDPQ